MKKYLITISMAVLVACNADDEKPESKADSVSKFIDGTFGYDLNFLKQYHKDLIVLGDSSGPQVIIVPAYQGRVMTSTTEGSKGISFGWVNHQLIASGKIAEHIYAVGGEERFWLGPEGGQFSVYFKKGVEFKFDNWFVPKEIDTEPFELVSSTNSEATFKKEIHLENYSGNKFDLTVHRTIRLLDKASISTTLGIAIPENVRSVAFESDNSITNNGTRAWDKKTGMLSIWILSMLNASSQTTVVVPYKQGDASDLGKIVTDDYFGKVPADRLKVDSGLILFKADAILRSKIGVSPKRALPFVASYDAVNNVLTIAEFTLPPGATDYVNSLWKLQEDPFAGDVVNAYNDGEIEGTQMGKFYEIESSSPAAALAPGNSVQHLHRTIHLKGSKEDLNKISMKILGKPLDAINL
ncbi:MAG TPA: DUF6786 family protein [Chitinophagaceae bacterium]|nr:DUF6786 family protein [Chitinophagaceae bacterium]